MWAVGLFEGEGCIFTKHCRRTSGKIDNYPALVVTSTDKDTLVHFLLVVGGRVNGPYKNGGYKPVWRWRAQALTDTTKIIKWFYPYLGKRRQQCARKVFGKELFK
jgi:hypothetical protein